MKLFSITQPYGYFWQSVSVFVDPCAMAKDHKEVIGVQGGLCQRIIKIEYVRIKHDIHRVGLSLSLKAGLELDSGPAAPSVCYQFK